MSRQTEPEELLVPSAPLAPQDERLEKLFDEMEQGSLKTLEDAARQIITLATALLGAFFGLLALEDAPAYLDYLEVKFIGAGALLAFFGALLGALLAVFPRRYTFPRAGLSAKRETLEKMLRHKHQSVRLAVWAFGCGALLLLAAALDVLFRL